MPTDTFDNGDMYEGEMDAEERFDGKGTLVWKSGWTYEGFFRKDKLQGEGCLYNNKGVFYFGRWEMDRFTPTEI